MKNNTYIFYVGYDENGVYLDAMHRLSVPDMDLNTLKVARKLDPKYGEEDAIALEMMNLRKRFQMTRGPYVVRTKFDLNRFELEQILKYCQMNGELKQFLSATVV